MAASRVPLPLYTFCLLGLLSPSTTVAAEPQFVDKLCPVDPPSTNNHSVDHHLTTTLHYSDLSSALFSGLSTNPAALTNGFYRFTAGRPSGDASYGLFLWRGDLSPADCLDCIVFATKDVATRCPGSKQVIIWYDKCMLRYSNVSIFGTLDVSYHSGSTNDAILIEDLDFPSVLGGGADLLQLHGSCFRGFDLSSLALALDDIVAQASSKKFATKENLSMIRKLYSLAQCTPDLSAPNCSNCLSQCTDNLFSNYGGYSYAMYRFPSCNAGFATFPFYSTSTASPQSPPPVLPPRPHSPPPVLPPRSPPPVLPLPHLPTSNPGKKGISFKVLNLIAIVVPIGVSIIVLSVACFCFISRRAKKKLKNIREDSVWTEITSVKSLQYDLGVIQAATNNLSDENKIGGDGFGPLYKGLLADGQTIAVKKLSRTSGQGIEEFKNEVVSVATLQHRNLVKLLGFCLEGEEKILIYELAPNNKSLDCVLFDPQQQHPLDWSRRYKIIREIAGGMLYLHEDSLLRIIHSDLKASNILLDGDMNVYISDFGIARILGVDKNQGNAREIDGTLDHMSSKYAMHGQWSFKYDVFSFGVLILEIITGKKNNVLYQSDTPMDLLSYARKLWSDEAPLDLMDATEIGPYSENEVIRCIHVALLCVQDDADVRPSMAIIVPMLDGYSTTLSIPQPPAFLAQSRTDIPSNRSRSKSIVWSVNEVSISELEPR